MAKMDETLRWYRNRIRMMIRSGNLEWARGYLDMANRAYGVQMDLEKRYADAVAARSQRARTQLPADFREACDCEDAMISGCGSPCARLTGEE